MTQGGRDGEEAGQVPQARGGGAPLSRRRALLGGLVAAVAAPALRAQPAASWPHDRVTIVTSLPAGSTVDLTTRVIAERLAQVWGKPVVVDNRGGAHGVLACQMVARAQPDGLTLLATSAMTHAANPALFRTLSYDPVRDFAAVSRFGRASPFVVMANRNRGAATLAELTVLLKREPGRHNFGSGSVPSRIASELFRQITGADMIHVGYRGNQQGFPDLVEGRITMMSVDVVGAKPLVDRGSVHGLVLSDEERHPGVPGVPTSAEAGLPEFQFTTWSGVYAPAATPREIVEKIARDMQDAMDAPEARARLEGMGSLHRLPEAPAEFGAFTAREVETWGRIIRRAGITLE